MRYYDPAALLIALLLWVTLMGGMLGIGYYLALVAKRVYKWIECGPPERAFWRSPTGEVIRVELPFADEPSLLRRLAALAFAAVAMGVPVLLVLNIGTVLDALDSVVQLLCDPYAS